MTILQVGDLETWGLILGNGRYLSLVTVSSLPVGVTEPLIQCIVGAIYPGVKHLGHEFGHIHLSGAMDENAQRYTSLIPTY